MTDGSRQGSAARIYTIGHSNRSMEEFLALLKKFGIHTVADIRKLPGSRMFPHFNGENLADVLPTNDIKYVWIRELGGLRHRVKGADSPNKGLNNAGFRAYADFMDTEEFRDAVGRLLALAFESTTAYMCAEAVFWRCHRRLLSDYLVANGAEVLHILSRSTLTPHTVTKGAVVMSNGRILYPPRDD